MEHQDQTFSFFAVQVFFWSRAGSACDASTTQIWIWLSRYGSVGRYCGYEHARQFSDLQIQAAADNCRRGN